MKKNILREDIPCWYEISYLCKEKPAILIHLHKDFVKKSQEFPINSNLISSYQTELSLDTIFDSFCGSLKAEEDFGFNKAFKYQGKNGDFTEFIINIPQVIKIIDKPCSRCGGKGEDSFRNDKCLFCGGDGKERQSDWNLAYAVSASFTLFSKIANFFEISEETKETSSLAVQLLTVETETQKGDYGGSIWGKVSPSLAKWLEDNPERDFSEIKKVMIDVYERMMGKRDNFSYYDFRVSIGESGGIHFSCPGNACGIDYSRSWMEGGYEFDPHNTDTPIQQLTLLAGLAALHDKARKEMVSLPPAV